MSPLSFRSIRLGTAEKTQVFKNRVLCIFCVFVCLFVCLQYEKQSNLKTKTCTLIWDTNPRLPPNLSSIGLRTAEKLQFLSVPTQHTTTHMNFGGQVNHSPLQQTKTNGDIKKGIEKGKNEFNDCFLS
jgi:hypothetical protein